MFIHNTMAVCPFAGDVFESIINTDHTTGVLLFTVLVFDARSFHTLPSVAQIDAR